MTTLLSPDAVARYRAVGYHSPERCLSADEAAALRARLEAAEGALGQPLSGPMRQKPHLLFTWLAELVRNPRVLDAVEDLLGSDILCWSTGFFIKEARTDDYVSWHQDATYWGLSGPEVVTAWIALTPSTRANGCMRVIPGTHDRQLPHLDTFAPQNLLTRGQEIAVAVDEAVAVDIVLAPGEFSLHHVRIAHSSEPNRSDDRRIGFAIRYIAPHVRQVVGERDGAMLVRGTDRFGHFEPEVAPEADLSPAAIAHHRESTERSARVLYRGADQRRY
jgi:ectoine hydroxylase-related dioxygenase (phytanoyl-CoA dioxygenase family)